MTSWMSERVCPRKRKDSHHGHARRKRAFDATLRRRLLRRLRQQGWPTSVVGSLGLSWTPGAHERLEGATTQAHETKCGLPQVSRTSPMVFVLYIADMFLDDPSR